VISPRTRLLEIVERRAQLVHRAQSEREQVAAFIARGDGALAWIYKGRQMLQELGRRPLVVVALVALLVAWRPRRAFKWLSAGWSLWRLYRKAGRWLQRLEVVAGTPPARRPG